MAYLGKTREPAFQFYADQTTTKLAKELRRKMTPYEKALWQLLRTNKIAGLKFRRQQNLPHPSKGRDGEGSLTNQKITKITILFDVPTCKV
ncbi:MAG: DUF559 domain-containing protein [bacterium]